MALNDEADFLKGCYNVPLEQRFKVCIFEVKVAVCNIHVLQISKNRVIYLSANKTHTHTHTHMQTNKMHAEH